MNYQWNPRKAALNFKKHGVRFADAVGVFEDEFALWKEDPGEYDEDRYIALGADFLGRILVVVFTFRGETIRLISDRKATKNERKTYENRRV
ncbi:MAG: BrnT family toxin [Chloroflexi bacterium]|nr:BrnT family toxin [Chloroflexota bacterium]